MGSPRISFPHIHFVAAILSQRTFFMTQGEKLFIDGQLQEAYDVLLKEASEGSGRAMYLLGEYAKHGYIAPADKKLAKRYAEEG